jgi:hypothetical protein
MATNVAPGTSGRMPWPLAARDGHKLSIRAAAQ